MTHVGEEDISTADERTGLSRRSALVAMAGTGLALGPAVSAWAAPSDDAEPAPLDTPDGPDDQGVSRIPVEGVADGGTAAWETDTFELVALTWTGDDAPEPYVRVRTDGVWSPWSALPPDEHTAGESDVAGTEPLWVSGANAVEVSVAGDVPDDLTLTLIHPAPAPRSALSAAEPDAVTTAGVPGRWMIDKPTIRSRAAWGADESLRQNQDGVAYGDVRGAFVHHTATTNSYTSAEVRGRIPSSDRRAHEVLQLPVLRSGRYRQLP